MDIPYTFEFRLTSSNPSARTLKARQFAMHLPSICLCALVLAAPAAAEGQTRQDILVVGGTIYTADVNRPRVAALVVRGDRIVFAGSEMEARAVSRAGARTIDLAGRTVIPGMVDAHAHLFGLGDFLSSVDLTGAETYAEVVRRVAERSRTAKRGEWIVGRGWDQNLWADKQFPDHTELSRAVPDHPVALERVDGHATLANAAAMRLAGISSRTTDPSGGKVIRDASGNPSGVFVDNASGLIERSIPSRSRATVRSRILAGASEANKWGLVGVHDAGASRVNVEVYEELARAGLLTLRTYVMLSSDSATLGHYLPRGPRSALYNGRLWVRAVKLYGDGALGSRGAAMLAPYSDDPANTGLLVTSPANLSRIAEAGFRTGFQINIHAIGDRGNRIALDAIEAAFAKYPRPDHRSRIEHAQVVSPPDIPRFAQLGVIPSMQASHQTSDMRWAETRVGPERIKGAYAWRSFLDAGLVIPNGSDFPVEAVNPLLSFHASVTRQDPSNRPAGGWYPSQRMTREEALLSMTMWPAFAAYQEDVMGSLTRGKYADFVILDQDIMTVAPEKILSARVMATYLGGRAVFERK